MSTYRVAVFTGEKTIEFKELELNKPLGTQALVKIDSCALCTLEQRVYNGVMRYYPFAGGHEFAGTVCEIGDKVVHLKPGDHVTARILTNCGSCYYCRNGHENQCVISFQASLHEGINGPGGLSEYILIDESLLYKMANDINLSYAALTEPLACCVHSISQGNIELGDDVAVIGVGIMGAFHIKLAKLRGARVIAIELDPERLEIAKEMGADVLVDAGKCNSVEKVIELTEGRGANVVFCTVANPQSAAEAIAMAGKLGRVVLYSSFHPKLPIELDVNHVHYSEMIITGSVNPKIKDFYVASKLLSTGIVNPARLISEEVPFENIDYALQRAIDPETYRVIVKI
jgi:2-desacetyl-2-hydroxyethyl bacteriochlorophyllide A dehydrogenase